MNRRNWGVAEEAGLLFPVCSFCNSYAAPPLLSSAPYGCRWKLRPRQNWGCFNSFWSYLFSQSWGFLGAGTLRWSSEMSLWSNIWMCYCESVMTEGPERGWRCSSSSICVWKKPKTVGEREMGEGGWMRVQERERREKEWEGGREEERGRETEWKSKAGWIGPKYPRLILWESCSGQIRPSL